MAYGTHTTLDALRSNFQTLEDYSPERFADAIRPLFDAHNVRMADFMTDLIERTTDKERVFGTVDQIEMTKQSEFGRPDAQKITFGAVCGFPLESWAATTQWTRKSLLASSVAEVTTEVLAVRTADMARVTREAVRALFRPTNYTFTDYLMPRRSQVPLAVKALANADGLGLPPTPNAIVIDATTHTHFLGTATLTAADLQALGQTVTEHYNDGELLYYINLAQAAAVSALPGFTAYNYPGIVGPTTAAQIPGRSLRVVTFMNRPIGQFQGGEVWVKAWMPTNYIMALLRGQPRPLAMRSRTATSGNLVPVADDELYPLLAKTYEREFGMGVQERTSAAILYTANATYTAPTLPD